MLVLYCCSSSLSLGLLSLWSSLILPPADWIGCEILLYCYQIRYVYELALLILLDLYLVFIEPWLHRLHLQLIDLFCTLLGGNRWSCALSCLFGLTSPIVIELYSEFSINPSAILYAWIEIPKLGVLFSWWQWSIHFVLLLLMFHFRYKVIH